MIKEEDKELELLQNILSGNITAMKEFYTIYSGYLTTVCSRYISDRDDIKDVLQESFIKIFKAITNFEYKGLGSLRAWSTRINTPIWDFPDMIEEEDPDFDEIPTSVIMEMIRSLPIGYRTVFNLFIFENKSHKEIASILKITENTSASQLHRAKSLLVKQIGVYKSIKKVAL